MAGPHFDQTTFKWNPGSSAQNGQDGDTIRVGTQKHNDYLDAMTSFVNGMSDKIADPNGGLFGTAAYRNVGNTVNTVAAGDDPRMGHGFRNKLINGGFDIWQRGTSGFTGGYSADRWRGDTGGSTMTMGRQSFTAGDSGQPVGHGLYFMRVTVNSVAGNGNYAILRQFMEDLSHFSGKTYTLSFWMRAPAVGAKLSVDFGFFNTTGSLSSGAMPAAKLITATSTNWTLYSLTYQFPDFAGLGITDASAFLLRFAFDAGASIGLPVGQQSLAYMDFHEIQFEPGSVATPFEKRPMGVELALCQRYYEKSFAIYTPPALNLGSFTNMTGSAYTSQYCRTQYIPFKVTKRATPTITAYTDSLASSQQNKFQLWNGSSYSVPDLAFGVDVSEKGFSAELGFNSGLTANAAYLIRGNWVADAEI